MEFRQLSGTDLQVSLLGYGAAPLGNEYGSVPSGPAIRSVRAALDLGVNIIDTSPYYGATLAESLLGAALSGVDRDSYLLATKVGRYGRADFDFSAGRVRRSVDESLARLRTDRIDLIQVHDIEFGDLDQIIGETLPALADLQAAGKVRYLGVTGYPVAALAAVAARAAIDSVLSYCRYTLLDHSLGEWASFFADRGVAVCNASPMAMGALTTGGVPDWHPAPPEVLRCCARAVELCVRRGAAIEQLALRFSVGHPGLATTFVGMPNEELVRRNVRWALEPLDQDLLADVERELAPVRDRPWPSGRPENSDRALTLSGRPR